MIRCLVRVAVQTLLTGCDGGCLYIIRKKVNKRSVEYEDGLTLEIGHISFSTSASVVGLRRTYPGQAQSHPECMHCNPSIFGQTYANLSKRKGGGPTDNGGCHSVPVVHLPWVNATHP